MPVPPCSDARTTRSSRRSRRCTVFRSTRRPGRRRPGRRGVVAELTWWRDYAQWGTADKVPDVMSQAFEWLVHHMPHADKPT